MAAIISFSAALVGTLTLAFYGRSTRTRTRQIAYITILLALCLTVWVTPSFILQKGLGRLAMPVGLIWMAGFVGVCWMARKGQRAMAWAALALWLAYSVAGNNVVGKTLLWSLEADFVSPTAQGQAPEALDALFVLAGGTGRRSDGAVQLGRAGDRLFAAARMYHQGRTTKLVYASPDGPRDQTAEALEIWTLLGIPTSAVHRIRGPYNTRTEVKAFKALTQTEGWSQVGLMTSAWHLRRATALAQSMDWPATPYPADVRGSSWQPSALTLIPSGTGFSRVHVAMWEYVGRAVGR